MKRLISIIAVLLALVFALASCGETKGVKSAEINENGELVLTYTDGTTQNLGVVKGEKGDQGEQGDKGDSAVNENPQGLDFYLKDDGTYAVEISYAKYLSKVEIPATYNGKAVTEIGMHGFESDVLTEIIIPDTVTTVGSSAFEGCTSLANVYYGGDLYKWNAIVISGDNNDLFNANIYCNGVLVDKDDVGGSGTPGGGSVEGPIIPY